MSEVRKLLSSTPVLSADDALEAPLLPDDERRSRACEHIMAAFHREEPVYVRRTRGAHAVITAVCSLSALHWAAIFVLVGLCIYERPTWCIRQRTPSGVYPCDTHLYPGWNHNFISVAHAFIVEAVCLLILFIFEAGYTFAGGWTYVSRPRNWAKWPLLVLAGLDYIVAVATPATFPRIASLLRISVLAANTSDVRRQLVLFARIVPGVLAVMALTTVNLIFFAYFGYVYFQGIDLHYFGTFGRAMWQLLVLQTTSNSPDVWIKAITHNRYAFAFFFAFMLLSTYFMTKLFFSSVFGTYQAVQAGWEQASLERTLFHLETAYTLLDTNNSGRLTKDEIMVIMAELRKAHLLKPYIQGDTAVRLLFAALDVEGTNYVAKNEFMDLCTVLKVQWEREAEATLLERSIPSLASNSAFKWVRRIALSTTFQLVTDITVLIMCVATAVEALNHINQTEGGTDRPWDQSNLVDRICNALTVYFTIFFLVEVLLKVVVLGWAAYWRGSQNQLEFITAVGCLGVMLAVLLPNEFEDPTWVRYVAGIRIVKLLRLLRLLQLPNMFRCLYLFVSLPNARLYYDTIVSVLPKAWRLFQTLFCIMYAYAAIGMAFFGGLVNKDPSRTEHGILLQMDYGQGAYWPICHNDMPSGLVLMFQLLVVNNWFVFVEAYAAVGGNGAWWLYISYYIIGVVTGLNVLVSFVVETFQAEMEDTLEDLEKDDLVMIDGRVLDATLPLRHIRNEGRVTYAVLDSSRLISATDGMLTGRYRAYLRGYESSERKAEMLLKLLRRIPSNGAHMTLNVGQDEPLAAPDDMPAPATGSQSARAVVGPSAPARAVPAVAAQRDLAPVKEGADEAGALGAVGNADVAAGTDMAAAAEASWRDRADADEQ